MLPAASVMIRFWPSKLSTSLAAGPPSTSIIITAEGLDVERIVATEAEEAKCLHGAVVEGVGSQAVGCEDARADGRGTEALVRARSQ